MSIVKVWDDVYSAEELQVIWEVIDAIQARGEWEPERALGVGLIDGQQSKKRGRGLWLGSADNQVLSDDLHKINAVLSKTFQGFTAQYGQGGFWERTILRTNRHSNLLNYYEDGDYYGPHTDHCQFSAITWFMKDPKSFTGGDLFLPELKKSVEVQNNRLIIFPGHLFHQVKLVSMKPEDMGKGLGRYSITQFLVDDVEKFARVKFAH
ncbi:MAG: hypothetical protein RJA70_3087 [Pseudomonadota bacterium]